MLRSIIDRLDRALAARVSKATLPLLVLLGAMLGPWLMKKIGIHSPLARGLALGAISHGQGTAQAISEGDVQGAAAGVATILAAILTASVAPLLVPILLR